MYVKAPAVPHGVTWGDWIEIAGVYVVLALYTSIAAMTLRSRGALASGAPVRSIFLLLTATVSYVLGRGMHVASNAIHDMMGSGGGAELRDLVYFWDERAGHVLVDAARILFVIGLCVLERGAGGAAGRANGGWARLLVALGAAAYGFNYFATAIEGQTVILALPFTVVLVAWSLLARRDASRAHAFSPVRGFFWAAALISLLLFLLYGVWQRGFPEFTRAGIL